jgi:phenylacetate-CoA ligase
MEMPRIIEAQLIQETPELLRILVVPRGIFLESDKALLTRKLREHTGPSLRFEFEVLERIPRRASGKFQFVISKVPLNFARVQQTGNED